MAFSDELLRGGAVYQVAIDGPAGAGKSTVAKAVAARLSLEYIDTGAMYRAVGLKLLAEGIGAGSGDAEKLGRMLSGTDIDFADGRVYLDGRDVSGDIRGEAVSKIASDCSALPAVREKLVALQRGMGVKKSVLMDGRDIGSNVFPSARFKFFLTASPEERARRRCAELRANGAEADFGRVLGDIERRDYQDSHRALNPLVKSPDAREIDSTRMTAEEVTEMILDIISSTRSEAME
jgi:cytidylate kinase